MLGLAVVLLDGDARVLGDRLLEVGDALREFCLVRRLLDGRLDEAGLLARVRRDEERRIPTQTGTIVHFALFRS